MRRTRLALLLSATALVLSACSTAVAAPAAPVPSPAASPPIGEPIDPVDEQPALAVDWEGQFTVELPNGWTVTHCDGDAPLICFSEGERHVGSVEIGDYPLPYDYDGDARTYLLDHATSFLDGMERDRAEGCPGLAFEASPPVAADLGGVRGIKAGFRLLDASGIETERHVVYWAVNDGAHYVINAGAYDDDLGCLERLGEFEPHDLAIALPYLDRIVADTPLPAPTRHSDGEALADGTYEARIESVSGSDGPINLALVSVLSGPEALQAAREDGTIGSDEELPNDIYIREQSDITYPVTVSSSVRVAVYDCSQQCEHVVVDVDAFLTGATRPINGEHAIFTVEIVDAEVVEMAEIYFP